MRTMPLALLLYLTGAYPLLLAWRRQRGTSLAPAVIWATVAWAAWALVQTLGAWAADYAGQGWRYAALCLVGCAGVAVLGARRPGVGAWNFVVLGLLLVFLLSWAEGWLAGGRVRLGELRLLFLLGTVAVGLGNYLPTRLAPAALLVALASALEVWAWLDPPGAPGWPELLFGLAPWLGWAAWRGRRAEVPPVERLWLDFRDHYGLVWGQRVREQFNASVRHAGLPVELGWSGLRALPPAELEDASRTAALTTLHALLKRFGPHEPEA